MTASATAPDAVLDTESATDSTPGPTASDDLDDLGRLDDVDSLEDLLARLSNDMGTDAGSVTSGAVPLDLSAAPADDEPAPLDEPGEMGDDSAGTSERAADPERTTSNDLDDLLLQLGSDADRVSTDELSNAPLTDPRDLERPNDREAVVIESTRAIDFDPDFASYPIRAASFAIDSVITAIAVLPGAALAYTSDGALRLLGLALILVGFGLVTWAYARAVANRGQWIGNRITSTSVVQVAGGGYIDQTHAASRFITRALMSPFLLLGFAVALTNTSRRTFHDQVAGSIVTGQSRASWSIDDPDA